jgi:hypothetical protein
MYLAAQVATIRRIRAIHGGRTAAHDIPDKDQEEFLAAKTQWQNDIEGAMGECAAAIYFDKFWDGGGFWPEAGDVGKIEIRQTSLPNNRLIIYPKDSKESRFVSVVGMNGKYTLRGWIYGHEGMKDEFWKAPKGRFAWWVDNDILRPMSEF